MIEVWAIGLGAFLGIIGIVWLVWHETVGS